MTRTSTSLSLLLVVFMASSVAADSEELNKALSRLRIDSARKAANNYLAMQKKLAEVYAKQEIELREQLSSQLEAAVQEATGAKNYTELQKILDARDSLQGSSANSPSKETQELLAIYQELRKELESLQQKPAQPNAQRSIPEGAVKFGEKSYFIFDQGATWHHASKLCQQLGGYLARIESAEENEFLKELVRQRNVKVKACWIDGSDALEEGKWMLSNGQPMLYTDWGRNEPQNTNDVEHQVSLWRDFGWKWGDVRSSKRYPYICEWD